MKQKEKMYDEEEKEKKSRKPTAVKAAKNITHIAQRYAVDIVTQAIGSGAGARVAKSRYLVENLMQPIEIEMALKFNERN